MIKMKLIILYLLIASISKTSLGNINLLEMSQTLWSKLLNGGLTNIGPLDPLRIPVVKVDQSQNKTNYRIILNNIEIVGLNQSTLESIHIGKGRVKSNLSEHEAGYVSYSDRNVIDSIRYRFHTVVKEPKTQDNEQFKVQSIETFKTSDRQDQYTNDPSQKTYYNNNQQSQQRYNNNNQRYTSQQYQQRRDQNYPMQQEFDNKRNEQRTNGDRGHYQFHYQRHPQPMADYSTTSKTVPVNRNKESQDQDLYLVYAQSQSNYENQKRLQDNQRPRVHSYQATPQDRQSNYEHQRKLQDNQRPRVHSYQATPQDRQSNYEHQRKLQDNQRPRVYSYQATPQDSIATETNIETQRTFTNKGNPVRFSLNLGSKPPCVHEEKDVESIDVKSTNTGSSSRLENQPGYVDIVYADQNDNKMRRFGNLRIESTRDKTVYRLEDVMKDLDNHRRFIIHNFTDSELLLKRNDAVRTAEETRRIKDLIRYAKDFQEKQGYFEEGMEITYHYGNESERKVFDGKRSKRAHSEDENEDDIIHVIMKIHAPLLKIKSDYVLMGKVGNQVLRGNGVLDGQFTDVTGEFTVELKKTGNTTMIVRAARAKLEANNKNVTLQGMDENGPVEEILTQGLLAAEAVAAMLADDLATKILNDTVTDAIIYKMYKELPNN
ncbi:transcription factor SPT20 homolog [Microplitis mediator]|uniref:transcription factor SPT20 homolog n=1 Tax=Microplitis mediator TaxID=375433 RepID=UPI0025548514|nr:transcription factor SPT20 homolog [Microplitis mediator]